MPRGGKTAVLRSLRAQVLDASRGKEIQKNLFIFENIRTHQVLYTLKPELQGEEHEEARLLKQLTFVGKKSVPGKLRPDLWRPLATLSFSNEQQCLVVYRKLREYRMMREHCWRQNAERLRYYNADLITQGKKPVEMKPFLPPSDKGRAPLAQWLMDQKKNAIVDLAAAMEQQSQLVEGLSTSFHDKWLQEQKSWLESPKKELKTLKEMAESEDTVDRIKRQADMMTAQVAKIKKEGKEGNPILKKKAIARSTQHARLIRLQEAASARKQGDEKKASEIETAVLNDLHGRIRSVERAEVRKVERLKQIGSEMAAQLRQMDVKFRDEKNRKRTHKFKDLKTSEALNLAQVKDKSERIELLKQRFRFEPKSELSLAAGRIEKWMKTLRPGPALSPNLPELGPARRLITDWMIQQRNEANKVAKGDREMVKGLEEVGSPVYIHWADWENTRIAEWPESVVNIKYTQRVRNAVGLPPPPRKEPQAPMEEKAITSPPTLTENVSGFFGQTFGKVRSVLRLA